MQLRGCGTALVTPFRQDGAIDDTALRNLIAWQIESGVDFLVPCGTTGETPTLTHDEWLYVIDVAIELAAGREFDSNIDYIQPLVMGERRRFTRRAAGDEKIDSGFNLPRNKVAQGSVVNCAILTKGSNEGGTTSSELHETKITRTGECAKLGLGDSAYERITTRRFGQSEAWLIALAKHP